MHNNKNFFKNHKFLITIFIVFFIVFIASTFYGVTGIFFDTPAQFFTTAEDLLNGNAKNWYFFADERSRLFSTILLTIPYNLSLLVTTKDLITQISWFCASYHIVNFLGLICNYLIAKRTKRYDIAVIATFFYCLFVIPSAIWATREVHIASMLQFCLLSYFLSKKQLEKLDIFLILLLGIYLLQSFETSILVGIIFFVASVFYVRKNPPNKKAKIIIGLFGIMSALYIPIQTYLLSLTSSTDFKIIDSLTQWTNSIRVLQTHALNSSLLITYFGLIGASIIIFFNKLLKNNTTLTILGFLSALLLALYFGTGFMPSPNYELQFYILAVIFICPLFILIIALDYLNINLSLQNKDIYSNLLILSCIIGILNFSWQINSSLHFKNYVEQFKSIIASSNEPIRYVKEKDITKDFGLYGNCFGILHRSIILSPTYKIKTLLFPSKYSGWHQFCFDGKDQTYYDYNNNSFRLHTNYLKTKNDYWDLSDLIPEFKKQDRIK